MSRAHWCLHYGYRDGPTCAVGIDLSKPGKAQCCMPVPKGPRCSSREDLSDADIKAHEDRSRQAAVDAMMVLALIPSEGDGGSFACPACQAGTVRWVASGRTARGRSLAISAQCSTRGCVRFMS